MIPEEYRLVVQDAFKVLHLVNRDKLGSAAVDAVLAASERALESVIEKHSRRGDSWEETFSLSTCINLAGAKLKRVEILLNKNQSEEALEEMIEETGDALAYIAFGLWKIESL